MKKYNLATLNKDDVLKMNVEMAASAIAFKEKYNQFVNIAEVNKTQPKELQNYFLEKIEYYRGLSRQIGVMPMMSIQNKK